MKGERFLKLLGRSVAAIACPASLFNWSDSISWRGLSSRSIPTPAVNANVAFVSDDL